MSMQIPTFRFTVARQMADDRRRLAERLTAAREGKGLSREGLAPGAEVTPKTIERIEEQKVDRPRGSTIRAIAEALEIEPTALRPPPEIEDDALERIEQKLDVLKKAAGLGQNGANEAEEGIGKSSLEDQLDRLALGQAAIERKLDELLAARAPRQKPKAGSS